MTTHSILPLIEALVESELQDRPVVMFDMDGVLADFDAGVDQDSRAVAARDVYRKMLDQFPEMKHLTDDEVKKRLAGTMVDSGMKALKKAWNNYRQLKFMMTGKQGFFLNLPPLPGAKEMLHRAAALTGHMPGILTAPVDNPERCAEEKLAWMNKHFPGMFSSFHCTQDKHKFAHPNRILIDDRTKYTIPFESNGGVAILHKNPGDSMQKLENILQAKGLSV